MKTFVKRQFVITEEHMVNVKLIHRYVHDSVMHDYYVLHYITFTLDIFFLVHKNSGAKNPKDTSGV